ncbi:hypothetical protein XA68_13495 [Ophiocordyceps unilateralis]|uniref:Fungal lipase-type domain-containing protein n=1 Tax=Ophiocordyceps unilateralis TaxID=268505 RepID=A0A2A9PAY5_OPHUN|nr:hypothetical protein XA68_13495 [Ophiocordyceps unilateralis]
MLSLIFTLAVLAAILGGSVQQVSAKPDSGDQFAMFAQYSMAAYCPTLHDGFDRSDICSNSLERSCPNFDNTTTVAEFLNNDFYGVGGYVAANPNRRHIVVAFKGSDTMFDMYTDVSKGLVACQDLCHGCSAHSGFYTALTRIKDRLEQAVRAELKKAGRKGYRVVVTGHSLGGALASLAGVYLRNRGIRCDIYTYGAPLVGNAALASHIASQKGFTGRVTNARDLVTAIPQWSWRFQPYAHSFPEYWYSNGLDGGERQYEV